MQSQLLLILLKLNYTLYRSPEMIERERAVPLSELMDPEKDEDRCSNQDWLVVLGVCTHLGCVPIHHQGELIPLFEH